jgi:hypothetical protein
LSAQAGPGGRVGGSLGSCRSCTPSTEGSRANCQGNTIQEITPGNATVHAKAAILF